MFIAAKMSRGRRFVQIVESFRRPDGKPTHRVVASLGQMGDLELANLRAAFAASREKRAVVVGGDAAFLRGRISANLRFLNVAVALKFCERSGIRAALAQVLHSAAKHAAVHDVLVSLIVQRCVDPGSKLSAIEWFPTTALPELLAIDDGHFNNSRVHRALDALHAATEPLKQALCDLRSGAGSDFTTLFIDLTDTWFVGRGPEIAEKRKTKEGLHRRKIGIAMLCDDEGFPVDWEIVAGREAESETLCRMMRTTHAKPWAAQSAFVCDRALGKTCYLQELMTAGIRFLVPITKDQFESYGATEGIAHRFDDLGADVSIQQASEIAAAAGMAGFKDNGYVLDRGFVTPCKPSSYVGDVDEPLDVDPDHPIRSDLRMAIELEAEATSGESSSFSQAAGKRGLKGARRSRLQALLRLDPALQARIEAGEGAGLSQDGLVRIAHLDVAQQVGAFNTALAHAADMPRRRPTRRARERVSTSKPAQPLRCILCFNPHLFVDQRSAALKQRDEVERTVREANESPRLSLEAKRSKVERTLRALSLLDTFEIRTVHGAITAEIKPDSWRRSRRRDGFSVLAAHPAITTRAKDLALLYRQRNLIERNFQTIKSVIELRPVWHHTDAKVKAHVALCVLALWTQRAIEQQLHRANAEIATAACALELLSTCHLNTVDIGAERPLYALTTTTVAQRKILATLDLTELGTDDTVAPMITPR